MRREQVLYAMKDAVANNLTAARELDSDVERLNGLGVHTSAEIEASKAEHYRWLAGCGMSTINHLNGTSPE